MVGWLNWYPLGRLGAGPSRQSTEAESGWSKQKGHLCSAWQVAHRNPQVGWRWDQQRGDGGWFKACSLAAAWPGGDPAMDPKVAALCPGGRHHRYGCRILHHPAPWYRQLQGETRSCPSPPNCRKGWEVCLRHFQGTFRSLAGGGFDSRGWGFPQAQEGGHILGN